MSRTDRMGMVERGHPRVSVTRQCQLLDVARSSIYYRPVPASAPDLTLMRLIDEQYLRTPYYGSRRMAAALTRSGLPVNRKRIQRLMRLMGIEAIYQKPNTSRRHPEHRVYPYLLRGMTIDRINQDFEDGKAFLKTLA